MMSAQLYVMIVDIKSLCRLLCACQVVVECVADAAHHASIAESDKGQCYCACCVLLYTIPLCLILM